MGFQQKRRGGGAGGGSRRAGRGTLSTAGSGAATRRHSRRGSARGGGRGLDPQARRAGARRRPERGAAVHRMHTAAVRSHGTKPVAEGPRHRQRQGGDDSGGGGAVWSRTYKTRRSR